MSQLSEQELVRRDKLVKLRELGINPYPADLFPVKDTSKQIKANFEEGKKVVVAGRLMSRRIQGKASFAELQDSEGRIQVYFNRDEICPAEDKTKYNEIFKKLIDLGDFIGIGLSGEEDDPTRKQPTKPTNHVRFNQFIHGFGSHSQKQAIKIINLERSDKSI